MQANILKFERKSIFYDFCSICTFSFCQEKKYSLKCCSFGQFFLHIATFYHAISSTWHLINLTIPQLSISVYCWFHNLTFHQTFFFIKISTSVIWPFHQLVNSSTTFRFICHFINIFSSNCHFISFQFYQHSCLTPWQFTDLTFQWSTSHFIDLLFHQHYISSTCYFINLLFHQLALSSTWFFINLPFHQLAILLTWHFIKCH